MSGSLHYSVPVFDGLQSTELSWPAASFDGWDSTSLQYKVYRTTDSPFVERQWDLITTTSELKVSMKLNIGILTHIKPINILLTYC